MINTKTRISAFAQNDAVAPPQRRGPTAVMATSVAAKAMPVAMPDLDLYEEHSVEVTEADAPRGAWAVPGASLPQSVDYDRDLDKHIQAWRGKIHDLAEKASPSWMFGMDLMGPPSTLTREELNQAIRTAPHELYAAYLTGVRAVLIELGVHTGNLFGSKTPGIASFGSSGAGPTGGT